jgi:flagellar hook assembly protein FlgD
VVNPGRAGTRASSVYNIAYNLSIPANVSVSILTPGGHSVAQIVTRAVTAGDNSVTWNGLDGAGRPVASGSYVIQFQAATTDGQTTRVIRPFILTGR